MKFLKGFFMAMGFIIFIIGFVSGLIFLAMEITTFVAPYSVLNEEFTFFVALLVVSSAVMGCVHACEDM